MASAPFIQLTRWIHDHPQFPIFSILVSRNGKLVYELYTSSLGRQQAHYQMSVTKSVLSALVGIAVDRHLMKGPDASVSESLPRSLFASDADFARFQKVTLKQVMGMSGIDAPDPPRKRDAESVARYQRFWWAPNRVSNALQQPILDGAFQYNDSTPTLAAGALQYATGKSALAFAEENLFGPMGFRNYEWLHQDAAGMDNGGYGLRLRPIDMQKFGILYLSNGIWKGRQLISKEWVSRSFEPWNRSDPAQEKPDYGWFWWTYYFAPGWAAHVANGWKGQRIAVIPEQNLVVTMTGCIEEGEAELFLALITKTVMPSVQSAAIKGQDEQPLNQQLEQTRRGPSRMGDFIEYRMVPSIDHKQQRKPLKTF